MGVGTAASIAGCTVGAPTANKQQAAKTRNTVESTRTPSVDSVSADPTDLPPPINRDEPKEIDVTLRPREVTAEIEPGVTFTYMTFNGQVPGPFIRARRGDTINLTFENPEENNLPHNVDFHACYGPGGGAEATMTNPGDTAELSFSPQYPGAFIYHCAVPNLDMHISAGMYGLILVEPEGGLPDVDHELYLGQNEVYTKQEAGAEGEHNFDFNGMTREDPTYVLLNGAKYAFTPDVHGPAASVSTGETARVFFVNGGPNLTSSFHPIGNVWSELHPQGSLSTDPQTHIQTTPVSPGSTTVATMEFPVPGPVKIVDHALSRVARKGCLAVVDVQGEERPEIFDPSP